MIFGSLETPRLLLREFIATDAEGMFAYASDIEATRFMGWPRHASRSDSEGVIRHFCAASAGEQGCAVGIWRKSDGRLIGSTGWGFQGPGLGVTGWILRGDARGQGYAAEAVAALFGQAFGRWPGLASFVATIHPDNLASIRLALRLGMEPTGLVERHAMPNLDGQAHEVQIYRLRRKR
jgi:ribosomal-protein-alanine N-acetyltransferase